VQLPGKPQPLKAGIGPPNTEGWLLTMADPPQAIGMLSIHLRGSDDGVLTAHARVVRVVSRDMAANRGLEAGLRVKLVRPDETFESHLRELLQAREKGEAEAEAEAEKQRRALRDSHPRPKKPPPLPQRRGSQTRPEASTVASDLRNDADNLSELSDPHRLGVPEDADRPTIRKAYIALARRYDPALFRQYGRHDIVQIAQEICGLFAESERRMLAALTRPSQPAIEVGPDDEPVWTDSDQPPPSPRRQASTKPLYGATKKR